MTLCSVTRKLGIFEPNFAAVNSCCAALTVECCLLFTFRSLGISGVIKELQPGNSNNTTV